MKKVTFSGTEWKIDDIKRAWDIIGGIAQKKYSLDWYDPQYEIVTEEMMLQFSTTHGLPTVYDHWSFGKHFNQSKKDGGYKGIMEMIINSNPSVCYLMASNTLIQMLCVIAHAAVGHSSFFKNNYSFKEWTNADTVLPFMKYAKGRIKEFEEKYGYKVVEGFIDIMHAVQLIGVDHQKPKKDLTKEQVERLKLSKDEDDRKSKNYFYDFLQEYLGTHDAPVSGTKVVEDDNILRIFRKYGGFPGWQNELLEIFMYINQYFHPQMMTKVSNEGYATFWDYTLMKDLYDEGHITTGMYMETLKDHTDVTYQCCFSLARRGERVVHPYYRGINPYYLGYSVYNEIKRVCEEQDEESLRAVPCLRGANWVQSVKMAMENYRDDSFIFQYLTPKLVRDLKLATVHQRHLNQIDLDFMGMKHIPLDKFEAIQYAHDDDFLELRESVANAQSYHHKFPTIKSKVSLKDKSLPELELVYVPLGNIKLNQEYRKATWKYIEQLWGREVKFSTRL